MELAPPAHIGNVDGYRQTVRSIRLSTDKGIYHIETVGAYTFGFNDIVVSSNAERSFF